MIGMRKFLLAGAILATLLGVAATSFAQTAAPAVATAPITPEAQAARLGRGLNVLGYDPFWTDGAARFHARHFEKIRAAGFSTLRVNLATFRHLDAKGHLDPNWLRKLDWVIKSAGENGLNVILDDHDFNECAKDYESCRDALLPVWWGLAERYKSAPDTVLFELLNEPNGALTAERWNTLLIDALKVVRYYNPTRTVIIGPSQWNSLDKLSELVLPEADRNLIVTFHYYTPMEFTHQGASWVESTKNLHGVTWGSPADLKRIDADFDRVNAWSKAHHRPIFLGEFGALETGAMPARTRYISAVARAAEARGWPWAYWQFDSNFIAYDMDRDDWVHPILDALVPPAAAAP